MTLLLTPVMWAGPETAPQSKRLDNVELTVRLAKGPVEVEGAERSRQQDVSLEREQGVCVRKALAGRMMWALDWLEIEIEVVLEEREGRDEEDASPGSAVGAGWSCSRSLGGGAAGTGWLPVSFSLGGVWR
jgi:hypothetical protein